MSHAGARQGAGRSRGRSKCGEATQSIRIPISRIVDVMRFINKGFKGYQIPLYASSVRAGSPFPADDHVETMLDLNEHLIQNPNTTFFVRASGESMLHAGIHTGDLLVVDRSLQPSQGKIVVAAINGELTVKRLSCRHGKAQLVAENPDFPPLDLSPECDVVIWGVVTYVIHGLL